VHWTAQKFSETADEVLVSTVYAFSWKVSSGTPTGSGVYAGQIENGKPHGEGCFIYCVGSDGNCVGSVYEGQWKSGGRSGMGKMSWAGGADHGNIYRGNYKMGYRHGLGSYSYDVTGDNYKGIWENDRIPRQVTCVYANGDIYEGHLNDIGERHGLGKYTHSNGDEYSGQWVSNMKCGVGVLVANNIRFAGEFVDDHKVIFLIFFTAVVRNKVLDRAVAVKN